MKANLQIIKILKFQGETKQGPVEPFSCPSSLEGTHSTLPDLPWVPNSRFKHLLIREGRRCRDKRPRNNSAALRQGPGSPQFSSVTQSRPTLCDLMNRRTSGLPVHHQLQEFTQTHVHWVSDAIQPSHPLSSLLLLPPIPPSTRVFSNESTLLMRWPKYWRFSFSISPSNEHPGLISFRMDWLDLLAENTTIF